MAAYSAMELLYSVHGLFSNKYFYSQRSQLVELLYGLRLTYPAACLFSVSVETKWQFLLFTVSPHYESNQ
jgi:hypothetical protein